MNLLCRIFGHWWRDDGSVASLTHWRTCRFCGAQTGFRRFKVPPPPDPPPVPRLP